MIDIENTISNLETNIRWIESTECHQFPGWGNVTMAMRDALELLKEQEAVEPTFKQDKDGIFAWACGSCGAYMYHIYEGIDKAKEYAKYCRRCGRKVKWE